MSARINRTEHRLTNSEVSEQTMRRELFEALVTECDCNELLAETIAVLADADQLASTMRYAKRGQLANAVVFFCVWHVLEEKLIGHTETYKERSSKLSWDFGLMLHSDLTYLEAVPTSSN